MGPPSRRGTPVGVVSGSSLFILNLTDQILERCQGGARTHRRKPDLLIVKRIRLSTAPAPQQDGDAGHLVDQSPSRPMGVRERIMRVVGEDGLGHLGLSMTPPCYEIGSSRAKGGRYERAERDPRWALPVRRPALRGPRPAPLGGPLPTGR